MSHIGYDAGHVWCFEIGQCVEIAGPGQTRRAYLATTQDGPRFGGAMRSAIAWLNEFDTMKHCSNKNNVLGLDWMTMLPWRAEKKALCQRIVRDRIYKAVSLALPTVSDISEEALQ